MWQHCSVMSEALHELHGIFWFHLQFRNTLGYHIDLLRRFRQTFLFFSGLTWA